MEGYLPGAECSQCKGRCCRERGCSLSPQDMHRALARKMKSESFQPKEGELRDAVLFLLQKESGDARYAIDYFNTVKGPVFYLRMRHKCHTFIGVDGLGECIALTAEGCILDEGQRPKGGRFLKSSPDGYCIQYYTQEMMEEDWKPYQETLSSIWKEYEARFRKDGTFERCEEAYFAWMRRKSNGNKVINKFSLTYI